MTTCRLNKIHITLVNKFSPMLITSLIQTTTEKISIFLFETSTCIYTRWLQTTSSFLASNYGHGGKWNFNELTPGEAPARKKNFAAYFNAEGRSRLWNLWSILSFCAKLIQFFKNELDSRCIKNYEKSALHSAKVGMFVR